jgi:hypothetical protein
MNVRLPEQERFKITAKQLIISSFMCRISPGDVALFMLDIGTTGVLNLEIRKACLTFVTRRQTSSLVRPAKVH